MSSRLEQIQGFSIESPFDSLKDKLQKKSIKTQDEWEDEIREAEMRYEKERQAYGQYRSDQRSKSFQAWKKRVAAEWDSLTANFKGAALGITLLLSLLISILMFVNVFEIENSINYLFATTFMVIIVGVLLKQHPRVYSLLILVFLALQFFLGFLPFDNTFNIVFGLLLISVCIEVIFDSVKIMLFGICGILLFLLINDLIIFDLSPEWQTASEVILYIVVITTIISVLVVQIVHVRSHTYIDCSEAECPSMNGVWNTTVQKCQVKKFPSK